MDFSEVATRAIKEGKRVRLSYHGEERLVEVHAIGVSTAGKPCVRVYQVVGGAVFGAKTGWKMLSVQEIEYADLVEEASAAPRPGYNPGDKGMAKIYMEV